MDGKYLIAGTNYALEVEKSGDGVAFNFMAGTDISIQMHTGFYLTEDEARQLGKNLLFLTAKRDPNLEFGLIDPLPEEHD